MFFTKNTVIYAAFGMGCTLTAMSILTQPSTLRGTVNVIIWKWVIVWLITAYRRTQVKLATWTTIWWPFTVLLMWLDSVEC